MRILHTADLHLGRQFNGLALDEDQGAILDQIVAAIGTHDVDVLVIAGDIFDRAAPPASAVRQFNAFLTRVAQETRAAVVMIAGNHDSPDRIATMSIMTDRRRALIAGAAEREAIPLVLEDTAGPVAFSALPFAYEWAAREAFADPAIATPQDVLEAEIAAARRHVPEGARWVVVAHAFVAGGLGSDSERPLARIGGVETVSPGVFAGAHYVALGHLHRPQTVGAPFIRYSGAPLAFGFDEGGAPKSMSLVELAADGTAEVEPIPFLPPRPVRTVRGPLEALLAEVPSDDIIRAVLTDEAPCLDPMRRLRKVFPNACALTYARYERASEQTAVATTNVSLADPTVVIDDFLRHVRQARLSEPESDLVVAALDRLREEAA